jgi:cation:H+ antiporter
VTGTAVEGALWLLGVSVVVTALFWSGRVLSRREGGLLVVLNALDWLVTFVR